MSNEETFHDEGEIERAAAKTAALIEDETMDKFDEADLEHHVSPESIPSPSNLSVVSKRYDLENKGYLDENEKMMRKFDKNNDGAMDLREVYNIVAEVRRQQNELAKDRKKMITMRKIIIGLVFFLFVLALSMLGVSFAAAKLAKDTRVNPETKSLTDKSSGETLATIGSSKVGNVQWSSSRRRERKLDAAPGGKTMSSTTTTTTRKKRDGSLSSLSPLGQLVRRKVESNRRRRRQLYPCFGSRCGPSRTSGGGNKDDGLDTNRGDFNFTDFEWDDECDNLEGTITRKVFDDIISSVFTGNDRETTYILTFDDGDGLRYQYILYITESYYFDGGSGGEDEDVIGIQTQVRLECDNEDGLNAVGSQCDAYQPVFVFENCEGGSDQDKCDVYTCAYRGADVY